MQSSQGGQGRNARPGQGGDARDARPGQGGQPWEQGWPAMPPLPQPGRSEPRFEQPRTGLPQPMQQQSQPGTNAPQSQQHPAQQPPQPRYEPPQPARPDPQRQHPAHPAQSPQPRYDQPHPDPQRQQPQQPNRPPAAIADLADGEWHRMNPLSLWASMLSTLGAIISAVVLFGGSTLLGSLRGIQSTMSADSFLGLITSPLAFIVFGVIIVTTVISKVLTYYNREFRLTDEVLEMRSGVANKSNHQVRFDRLQSVNLTRPVAARIFGLTKLETSGAGENTGFSLDYLGAEQADALRAELLRRASGARKRKRRAAEQQHAQQHGQPAAPDHGTYDPSPAGMPGAAHPAQAAHPARNRRSLSAFVERAVEDFATPELEREQAALQSVVEVKASRIALTTLLGGALAVIITIIVGVLGWFVTHYLLRALVPLPANEAGPDLWWMIMILVVLAVNIIATGLSTLSTAVGNMHYTIAGTPDGLRVGKGLLTQTSDTVPPGRIHSVQVSQPLLWRPFRLYRMSVNLAGDRTPSNDDSSKMNRSLILPAGTREDVDRILQLTFPLHAGVTTQQLITAAFKSGRQREFTPAPARSWWLHPFSWRVIGGAVDNGVVFLRTGWLNRRLALVPGERIQYVAASRSLLERWAGVASLDLGVVSGPVGSRLPAVAKEHINGLHELVAQLAVRAAKDDRSHRWAEATAQATVAAAHMMAADARRAGRPVDAQTQRVLEAEQAWRREQQAGGAVQ